MAAPNRYDDPFWSDLAARVETKLSLPDGLLRATFTKGEASNNDAVSPKGAKTVFQIIPSTRDSFLRKYGIDAYLSPENAAEVAGLHLRDSLQRNGGDVPTAIAEYNASPGAVRNAKETARAKGGDWINFLPAETKAYVPRVLSAIGGSGGVPREMSTYDRLMENRPAPQESRLAAVHNAYKTGKMSTEDAASYEADVNAGKILLPRGETLLNGTSQGQGYSGEKGGVNLPDSVWNAVRTGKMDGPTMHQLAGDIASGAVKTPPGVTFDGKTIKFPTDRPRDVPGKPGSPETQIALVQEAEPSWLDKGIAGVSAAVNTVVGAPGQMLGFIGGALGGGAAAIANGSTAPIPGEPGASLIEQAAMGGAAMLSPQSSSELGRDYQGKVGEALAAIGPQPAGGAMGLMHSRLTPMEIAATGEPAVMRSNRMPAVVRPNPARAPAEVFTSNRSPVEQMPSRRLTDVRPADPPPSPPAAVFRSNRQPVEEPPITANWNETQWSTREPPVAKSEGPITFEWSEGVPKIVERPQRRAGDTGRPADTAAPTAERAAAPTQAAEAVAQAVDQGPRRGEPFAMPERAAGASSATMTEAELAGLVKTAAGGGMGAVKAQERIAEAAKLDRNAMAAAERLGIDLPADVFADNQLFSQAVAKTRMVVGSDAESTWRNTLKGAADRADAIMAEMDASPNVDGVSAKVRGSLGKTRDELQGRADSMYKAVDEAIPKATKVALPEVNALLQRLKKENPNTFSKEEGKLLTLASKESVTYSDLIRERQAVGKALGRKESLYSSVDEGALKQIYAALSKDQLGAVETVAGVEARDRLRAANALVAKRKALEKRILSAFGKEGDGSIATIMRTAIESSAKGDSRNMTKLMKALKDVPPELQRETMATAIASIAKSARNAPDGISRGDFGFAEFNKVYRGLQNNSGLYSQVTRTLGPGSHDLLSGLYSVSKRIEDARGRVITTGKANQAFEKALNHESLLSKILTSTAGRSAAVGASAMVGGPAGAVAAHAVTQALSTGKKNPMVAAGNLFKSPEFQSVLVATTEPQQKQAVKALVSSKPFMNWIKNTKLPREPKLLEEWVLGTAPLQNRKEK